MEKVNFSQLYTKITKGLSPKVKNIFDRRFGVKAEEPETLESIGQSLKITRERVRQIEEAGFTHIRKHYAPLLETIYQQFEVYFAERGGFKKEEIALAELGGNPKNKPYVLFFLTIGGDRFSKTCGKKDYDYFWSTAAQPASAIKQVLGNLVDDIKSHGKLLERAELVADFAPKHNLNEKSLASYLEVSRKIQENKEGKFGLVEWPEIKPRGVRDKAFLVFKKEEKPLHFRTIAQLIDQMGLGGGERKAHAQTVHNELIKDQRFVLVGRGTYALKEWGYVPGTIKEVITRVLKEKNGAPQEDVVKEVLAQRLVAKNTVLINLNNKKFFHKNDEGKYFVRETQVA